MSDYLKEHSSPNLDEESNFILYPPPPNIEDILYPPNINSVNSKSSEVTTSDDAKNVHTTALSKQNKVARETPETLTLDKRQVEAINPLEMLRSLYLLYLKVYSTSDKSDELLKPEIQTLTDNSQDQNVVVEVLDKQSDTTKSIIESITSNESPVKDAINPIETLHSLYLFHKDRKK